MMNMIVSGATNFAAREEPRKGVVIEAVIAAKKGAEAAMIGQRGDCSRFYFLETQLKAMQKHSWGMIYL